MIAPDKSANIYPRSVENVRAVLLHFFPKHAHSEINEFSHKLYDERKLELIEIEDVARQVNKHYDVLQADLREDQLTLSNAFHYGEDALINYPKFSGSKNRTQITTNLRKRIMSVDKTF